MKRKTVKWKDLENFHWKTTGKMRWRHDDRPDYGPAVLQQEVHISEKGEWVWVNVPVVVEDE